ncbi:MAG: VWA domain-containing protein [Proteobacteria bacterium]|uniref:VIT and vWA domain-containing protein n=1 Tax=Ottowia sp. TaxID=1898956 RepID=UPI001D2D9937|nr:VIT and VWA domain-containing protein [Ottowia sp.]MBS0404173.1 VWA domain-containing protein [Pseudomonadota bacterium]
MNTTDSALELDETQGCTVLRSVHGQGRIDGVLLTMTLRQAYRNDSRVDIEAVYTFPLAWAATLLELGVEIGGKRLAGQIVEKAQAERDYEQAIDKGDAAAMVERAGRDLYTVSVGNLKPGEEAVVELRYAQMLAHDHDTLRLVVPTALAPRYGDAVAAGKLQPHQVPQTDLLASQDFALELGLAGAAAQGVIRSPSHPIQFARSGDEVRVSLAGPALLDRDFVLTVEGLPQSSFAYVGADPVRPGEYVVAGSFCPTLAALAPALAVHADSRVQATMDAMSDEELQTLLRLSRSAGRSVVNLQEDGLRNEWARRQQRQQHQRGQHLALKVLVDCSGSMAGASMAQARAALAVLLEQLDATDQVSYSRFGTSVEHVLPEVTACGRRHLAALRQAFQQTDADMGGTELARALKEVVALQQQDADGRLLEHPADVLLITDGEVWDVEGIIAGLRHSGHRVHSIGVGAAPAQSLLQELAAATGGGCRLVHPGEDMRVAITELLQGLRRSVPVKPCMMLGATGHGGTVTRLQPNQTLTRWVRTDHPPERAPVLVFEPMDGASVTHEQPLPPDCGMHAPVASWVPGDTLARMWAQQMLLEIESKDEARQLALNYRLLSEQTNLLLVHERAEGEKATGMPAVAQVPHMLVAGVGGASSAFVPLQCSIELPAFSLDIDCEHIAFQRKSASPLEHPPAWSTHPVPGDPAWAGLLHEFDQAAHRHVEFKDAIEDMLACYSSEFVDELFVQALAMKREALVIWALVLRHWADVLVDSNPLGEASNRMLQAALQPLDEGERQAALQTVQQWFADGRLVPR